MNIVAGFLIVYVIPACFAVVFWVLVRAWVRVLNGRDVLAQFRPLPKHVHHTERLLKLHGLTSLGRRHD